VLTLAWVLLGGAAACGQQRPMAPMLQHIVAGRMGLAIVSGRLVNPAGWHFGGGSSTSTYDSTREELWFSGSGTSGSLRYRRVSPQDDLALDINAEGHFRFLRHEKENAAGPVEFVQAPGEPLTLSVGPQDHQQVYRAATLWHLALAQPELCQRHVYPLLEVLHPQWRFAQMAAQVETQLLKLTADDRRQQRQQWADLVAQLADDRFAKREAADRGLRAGGSAALAHLEQLDLGRLEPEQQFRIRRILQSVGRQRTDDTPGQAAGLLADDPSVWLALLARPDPSIRHAAVQRLATLLGEPLRVDPAADPASQVPARDALRARIEKAAGRGP
jgi:hypothetical protein